MTNAWDARASREVTITQRISPTREVVTRRTVYVDTILIDRMQAGGQLVNRIYDAACRLAHMRRTAGMDHPITARFDVMLDGPPDDDMAEADDTPPEEVRAVYDRLMRSVGSEASAGITDMLTGTHPGHRLSIVQNALDVLADGWGMEK